MFSTIGISWTKDQASGFGYAYACGKRSSSGSGHQGLAAQALDPETEAAMSHAQDGTGDVSVPGSAGSGMSAGQLFEWRKAHTKRSMLAVGPCEPIMPASELQDAMKRIKPPEAALEPVP